MQNPYGRKDVENLLAQLKKYKRIIRNYHENDISLEYYHIKSEVKELRSKLTDTKQKLSQFEEMHKDYVFDYHKLMEERNDLKQENQKLREDIKSNNSIGQKDKTSQDSSQKEDIKNLVEVIKDLLAKQNSIGVSQLNLEQTTPENSGDKEVNYLKRCKDLANDLVQSLNLIDNSLLISREGFTEKMESEKENQVGRIPVQNGKPIDNIQFNQEFIRGAESDNEISLKPENQNGDKSPKNLINETVVTNQSKVKQEKSTQNNQKSHFPDIKSLYKESKQESSSSKQHHSNNLLQQVTNQKMLEQGREFTFRDLQNATSVSQVIGSGIKENKNHLYRKKQHESKPVYVRYKEDKRNQATQAPEQLTMEEGSTPHLQKQPVETQKTNEPMKEESKDIPIIKNNTSQQIPEQHSDELLKEIVEKKSRLRLFWEKLTKL